MNNENKVDEIVKSLDPNYMKCTYFQEYVPKSVIKFPNNYPICPECLESEDHEEDIVATPYYDEYQDVTLYVDCESCHVEYIDLNGLKQRMELDAKNETDALLEVSSLLDFPQERIETVYL